MGNPIKEPETTICLDDIRERLSVIEDKQLVLDVLDTLKSQEKIIAEKTALNAEILLRNEKLVSDNNQLFARATQFNGREKPSENVDYNDINRNLNTIIDDI